MWKLIIYPYSLFLSRSSSTVTQVKTVFSLIMVLREGTLIPQHPVFGQRPGDRSIISLVMYQGNDEIRKTDPVRGREPDDEFLITPTFLSH